MQQLGMTAFKARTEERVATILKHCRNLLQESQAAIDRAHPAVAIVLRQSGPGGANVMALDYLCTLIGIQDQPGSALLKGLPLVGPVDPVCGHSTSLCPLSAATKTVPDLESTVTWDHPRVRTALGGPSPDIQDPDRCGAIWASTKREIDSGLLGPPLPVDPSVPRFGPLTARFGVTQVTSSGKTKVRSIDDF
jgi:hypothetical protein